MLDYNPGPKLELAGVPHPTIIEHSICTKRKAQKNHWFTGHFLVSPVCHGVSVVPHCTTTVRV